MHMNCYVCDNDNCQTHFAIESLNDSGTASCPNCGDDVTDTSEVIVDPHIMGRSTAIRERRING